MEKTEKLGFGYNRRAAVIVLVIVVLFSIWMAGGRGLAGARSDVAEIYYNGVEGDGIGIQKDLSVRFSAAAKLKTLGDNNGVDTAALAEVLKIYDKAEGIAENAAANAELDGAVYSVYNGVNNSGAGEADLKSAQSLYNEISSRGNMIKNDGYNSAALEFNKKTLGAFPASLIAGLRGIDELEIFR